MYYLDGNVHFLDIKIDKNHSDIYYKETHLGQQKTISWNAYPKYVHNFIINRLKSNVNRNDNINNNKDYRKVIWINLPYLGKKGEQLTNSLIRKLKRSFKESVKLKTIYKTNKLSMFCNTKDNISVEQKSNVIYRITCPGCFQKYVSKTDRNVITRLNEHGTKIDQPMYQHLSNCSAFNDHTMLFTLPDVAINTTIVSKELHLHNAVINNMLKF